MTRTCRTSVCSARRSFDETLPGPFEWDLKRLATSFVVAARAYGLGNRRGRLAAEEAVRRYAATLAALKAASTLDIWYSKVEADDVLQIAKGPRLRRRVRRRLRNARRRDSVEAYSKLSAVVDGRHVIVDDPPLIVHPSAATDEETVRQFWEHYRATVRADRRNLLDQYEIVDVARKVVGVGSVGTHCYVALLMGRGELDVLFLQVKQASASVLEPYLGRSEFDHSGERVVVGQRLMQAASDLFLGWATSTFERDFFVRQLRDMKMSADFATLPDNGFFQYAGVCGDTLARAHANTCDPSLIAEYVGSGEVLSSALTKFAVTYADQTEFDYAQLVAAQRDGLVEATVENRAS